MNPPNHMTCRCGGHRIVEHLPPRNNDGSIKEPRTFDPARKTILFKGHILTNTLYRCVKCAELYNHFEETTVGDTA